jgi:hypothetical protein
LSQRFHQQLMELWLKWFDFDFELPKTSSRKRMNVM